MSPLRRFKSLVRSGGRVVARVLALCRILDASGARVIATDLAAERPDSLGALEYRPLDVTSPEDGRALAAIGETVDGLVNNAGVAFRARLGDVQLDDWNRVIAVNLTGAMLGMHAIVPLMPPGSAIVNIGSAAAVTAHHTVAYTASKWGLRGLSSAAGVELGARGIRCNLVTPATWRLR